MPDLRKQWDKAGPVMFSHPLDSANILSPDLVGIWLYIIRSREAARGFCGQAFCRTVLFATTLPPRVASLVLSRICADPDARLGRLAFKSRGAFPSQC